MPGQDLTEGTVFAGDYRVVRALNSGGMGAVYVVDQLSTGMQRGLKVMHPRLVSDPSLRQRFEQEARVAARIESDHVVQVLAAGIEPTTGCPWLVMELLHGEDLSLLVRREGALPRSQVRTIFDELCHGVGAAHSAGVVHRDLKPENIFLAESKRASARFVVKVLDFGIAKIVAEGSAHSTATIGSPLWMAPEQTSRGAAITFGTDVWALGLIAFHLLTGQIFWRCANDPSASMTALLREIVLDVLPPASVRAAEYGCSDRLPPGFDAWFEQCVARDPRQRFGNAHHANRALRTLLDDPETAATGSAGGAGGAAASPPRSSPAAITPARSGPPSWTRAAFAPTADAITPPKTGLPKSRPLAWWLGGGGAFVAAASVGILVAVQNREARTRAPTSAGPAPLGLAARDGSIDPIEASNNLEARTMLTAIKKNEQGAFSRPQGVARVLRVGEAAVLTHKLCPSARRTPGHLDDTHDRSWTSSPHDWMEDPGWKCLKLTIDQPQYFQYEVEATDTSFQAFARRHVADRVVVLSVRGEVKEGHLMLSEVASSEHPFDPTVDM